MELIQVGGVVLQETKIKIVLADDNKDFSQILREFLNKQEDMEVVGCAANGVEACELVKSCAYFRCNYAIFRWNWCFRKHSIDE